MCYHTEKKVADQTFYLTQSQYTDTRPTSPSTDPIMAGAWQDRNWRANFSVIGMTRPPKILHKWESNSISAALKPGALTTWQMKQSGNGGVGTSSNLHIRSQNDEAFTGSCTGSQHQCMATGDIRPQTLRADGHKFAQDNLSQGLNKIPVSITVLNTLIN